MKRFLKIVNVFLNSKYIFSIPKNIEVLIFDDISFDEIKHVFVNFNYEILQTRINNISKIYVSPRIIFNAIKNYKGNILSSYLISLIQTIKPKVVFTFIDNSYKFSEVAKTLHKDIKFVALQNGARYEILENSLLYKKRIIDKNINNSFFIPNFFCFGETEINDYKKHKIKVNKFFKVGCLRLENYLKYKKKYKKKIQKKYDICLLSEVGSWSQFLNNKELKSKFALLAKYCIKFSMKNKKKIILSFKRKKTNIEAFKEEQDFYKEFLTKNEYNFLKKKFFLKSSKFGTYQKMDQSKVVVGTMSTLLRENLRMGGKSFVCNLTNNKIFNFPIKGDYFVKKKNYSYFENKLFKLLKTNPKNYSKKLKINDLISNLNTSELIIKNLKRMINLK